MKTTPVIPQTYAEWHHCITAECRIVLEPRFIAERLAVLTRSEHEETRRFVRLYGTQHWRMVVSWFEQAGREVGVSAAANP
jgi:hypothetical protein